MKRKYPLILIGITVHFLTVVSCISLKPPPNPLVKSGQPRYVSSATNGFDPLWSISNVYAHSSGSDGVQLASDGEDIFFLGGFPEWEWDVGYYLTKLSSLTGEVFWQIPVAKSPNTVTSDTNSVYVGLQDNMGHSYKVNSTRGAGEIMAFEADTGSRIWRRSLPGARSPKVLLLLDSLLSVDAQTLDYYLLDSKTGEIVERNPRDTNNFTVLLMDDIRIEHKEFSMQAINRQHGRVIWTHDIGSRYPPPIFMDGIFIVRAGAKLSAIDVSTGEVIWEYDEANVIGNITLGEEHAVYFLTESGLFAVDFYTGQVLGNVTFISESTLGRLPNAYSIAASNDIVVAYFGDSHQLFAFRFSPSE